MGQGLGQGTHTHVGNGIVAPHQSTQRRDDVDAGCLAIRPLATPQNARLSKSWTPNPRIIRNNLDWIEQLLNK
jgi:hypothetical protein